MIDSELKDHLIGKSWGKSLEQMLDTYQQLSHPRRLP